MTTKIILIENVKLKNPILIEGLPGIGNVGRVAAGYLISELKMKKFAELYSSHFLPVVILHESTTHALRGEFYYQKNKDRGVIVFTGDTQSITTEGHYEICEEVLEFAKKLGVKTIITLGGFAEGEAVDEPKVIGAVNDDSLVKIYEKFGIDFKDHSVGTIVGASGLLVGLGKLYDIDGVCLMGQTIGLPMVTDPKAADRVLHVLSKIINIEIDMTKLEQIVEDMEVKLKKAEDVYKHIVEQQAKSTKDDIKYIG